MAHVRFSLCLAAALGAAAAAFGAWQPGARVIVEKAGAGHRAIVLRAEETRCLVAYEGADERFDEWVDLARIRAPKSVTTGDAVADEKESGKNSAGDKTPAAQPAPAATVELLPHTLGLPRPADGATVPAWLEQAPRAGDGGEPVRFSTAQLAAPVFKFGAVAGISSARAPLRAVPLGRAGPAGGHWGFAAIEEGVVIYRQDSRAGFVRAGELDLSALGSFVPEVLQAGDLNADGATDLVVAGGPVVQVFFGTADGRYVPAASAWRGREPVRFAATGRFSAGPLPWGIAVVEGDNSFRLLTASPAGVKPAGAAFTAKFDRITWLVAGDFDGDGFSDIALTTENDGRCTGAWMYFNQHGAVQPFLWPVAGKDDFARSLHVADLDRDGRDDLVMTDSDAQRGERIRVVFGSAGRAGWEDPWELIGSEFGVGLGTASVVTGDFNRDGRPDIGITGRNGLRIHLGADYRRFSRNPAWPRLAGAGDFPEQTAFIAADFSGAGTADLLGYTPAFATGYNLLFNATPAQVAGVLVPPPLNQKAPVQASTTLTKVETARSDAPPDIPVLRHLASRAEPYGQYRYRIIVEVAALGDSVIGAVDAVCRYEAADSPSMEAPATCTREGAEQWFIEAILPRGRNYTFTITARDDKGRKSEPLRVNVSP